MRTDVDTLYTDGGHGGPVADQALAAAQVEHIQTAIHGRTPDKLHLADFVIQSNSDGKPSKVTCPGEQTAPVHTTCQQKAFVARFEIATCHTCLLANQCPTQAGIRDERRRQRFTQSEARTAECRRTLFLPAAERFLCTSAAPGCFRRFFNRTHLSPFDCLGIVSFWWAKIGDVWLSGIDFWALVLLPSTYAI